ncbi:MAG TPA: site-2 protease family protein [Kofleriaceae bacterium]|nr:site-2 protease family protein [Kofleriaceae bacterium]
MLKTFRLGTFLGFPVDIKPSFVVLLGLVLIGFGGVTGVALMLLVFASVVLHELGHAVAARRVGVHVSGIDLGFLGGAAKMQSLPRNARDEVIIAAAGPAVSLALGALGVGLGAITHVWLFAWLGWANFILAAFNLIPALPMDGGRILRALLTRKMDYVKATDTAVTVARVIAIAFVVIGIMGPYQLILLAPFLWIMGTREKMIARMTQDNYLYSPSGYHFSPRWRL